MDSLVKKTPPGVMFLFGKGTITVLHGLRRFIIRDIKSQAHTFMIIGVVCP